MPRKCYGLLAAVLEEIEKWRKQIGLQKGTLQGSLSATQQALYMALCKNSLLK